MINYLHLLSGGLLALVTPAFAQLPYNPTQVLPLQDGSGAYLISPQPSSSQCSLSILDTSKTISSTTSAKQLQDNLPFLSGGVSKAFVAIHDPQGISVLAGNCHDAKEDLKLWKFTRNETDNNGTWTTQPLNAADASLSAKYLSAGFTFSQTTSIEDASLFVFGGMCPNDTAADAADWTVDATYSNTMLTLAALSPLDGSSQYQVSLTGSRAPPIPEAGLTITPLAPTFSNTTGSNVSQQQNFVLLGGHTQTAFLNMSQLAIFSLPQQSWAFVAVSQPSSGTRRLKSRDLPVVEPRSGHTAVLTSDGSKIVVLGGWVGNVSNPALPQVVVLELGQGFGGQGEWAWTIPTTSGSPFSSGQGIYGHGAGMLPGDVMMVAGGYLIDSSTSNQRRQLQDNTYFFNTTSLTWAETYTNPFPSGSSSGSSQVQAGSTGLKPSEKAGLGAGLGVGLAVAIGVAIVWLLYSRKLRARRALREKELRELALGAERLYTPAPTGDYGSRYPDMRSASWGGLQERQIESTTSFHKDFIADDPGGYAPHYAERTGALVEVPSPTRGLRKNLNTRNPSAFGAYHQHPAAGIPGPVFRIDEEDESSQPGSLKRRKSPHLPADRTSVASDPFKDPPGAANSSRPSHAAHERQKEVEGWVEDWQSAAESMTISRSTSQAHSRTYSNLSQFRSQTQGDNSGRGSPEKSDRTGSNLSEKSISSASDYSRSVPGTVSRTLSQRSVSAGYALFSGAAAAMNRLGGSRPNTSEQESPVDIARAPSSRSVSLNMEPNLRTCGETFSSARNAFKPVRPSENQALINRNPTRLQQETGEYQGVEWSPSKDKYARAGSLTGSGRRALNLLGSVKRVFTGTGSVDVNDRVATLEGRSGQSSPTKHSGQPEMAETAPRRTLSAGASFWREKQGPEDWNSTTNTGPASSVRRRPVPGLVINDNNGALEDDDADWDVETAVQQRVVQVMFTVPKEKLRVVNADALSLLSSNRSEADQDDDKEREQLKRMSSVREGDEDYDHNDTESGWKGKGKERAG
ncbi:uncharacterized protein A1O9_11080 [Exophiala aquamarina CBS 119918]|uniref:Galactose oxidase n=1 Tax=Exophiala aquamarina CBS 119918 TaxID=1182545 RepID=A0A072P073_9EURO|nr:uncharacterized protein A1O9_11080 [Exophiala aquamarina CBS 119918]KEF52663.1 hypothetical protein A1O9_11080 [Exophiala aquamarina CBS 119918]